MKLIIAYIQPEALNEVKQSLYEIEVYKLSITNAMGCGQQKGFHETYRGADIEVNLLKKVRLEIAINDEYVESTTDAIIKGAPDAQDIERKGARWGHEGHADRWCQKSHELDRVPKDDDEGYPDQLQGQTGSG